MEHLFWNPIVDITLASLVFPFVHPNIDLYKYEQKTRILYLDAFDLYSFLAQFHDKLMGLIYEDPSFCLPNHINMLQN